VTRSIVGRILPLFTAFALTVAPSLVAQNATRPSACTGSEYSRFDFWVGDWEVHNAAGKLAGTSHIEKILGGCAIQEHWSGAGGGNGTSLNLYDAISRKWHQTYVDNGGLLLQLDGDIAGGRMVLSGTLPAQQGGGTTMERISWMPLAGGAVRQLWERSADGGATWSTVFDGRYSRSSGSR
jgi:hypothetical protein